MKFTFKDALSILAGLTAAWLIGLILFPILGGIGDGFDIFNQKHDETASNRDSNIFGILLLTWYFLSFFAGGFFVTLIKPRMANVVVCMLLQMTIFFILLGTYVIEWLLLPMIPLGYLIGGWAGKIIKRGSGKNDRNKTD